MDQQDYWEIAERDIEIQNPVTDRKLRLLDDYCDIRDGLRILDIGCGKAWIMRRWAEMFEIQGVGLDVNRRFIDTAIERAAGKRIGHKLTFVHGSALDYQPAPQSFDIVMCLGATFALGGFVEALEWMAAAAKPGASIVVGDITLKHRPLVQEGPLPYNTIEAINVIERHGGEVSATISASEAAPSRCRRGTRQEPQGLDALPAHDPGAVRLDDLRGPSRRRLGPLIPINPGWRTGA